MKKLLIIIAVVATIFSCGSPSSSFLEDYAADKEKARKIAEKIVKEETKHQIIKFDKAYSHELKERGFCVVSGKYTAKNTSAFSDGDSEYNYKITLHYSNGNWKDIKSWMCTRLIVEDAKGNIEIYGLFSADNTVFLNKICHIAEIGKLAIRIQTPRKFTESEIREGLSSFKYKEKETIQFCLAGKTKRGEEYASAVIHTSVVPNGVDVFVYDDQKDKAYLDKVSPVWNDNINRSSVSPSISPNISPNISRIIKDKTKCYVMAQCFVKKETLSPKSTKFNISYGHEKVNDDIVKIVGKFTTKNAYGVEIEYHFRIKMKFKGGEWEDENNWEVISLEFE